MEEGARITLLKDEYWKRLRTGENEVYRAQHGGPRRGAQTWEIDSEILQAAPNRGGKRVGWRGRVGDGEKINWQCEGRKGKR